jgi:hypothetical protein
MKTLSTPPVANFAAALALAVAAAGVQAAGTVTVTFVNPEKYTDAGRAAPERQRTLDALQRHFTALGVRLPTGQALKVEILDVDLAGEITGTPHLATGEQRVLKGGADGPHMKLRYSLAAGGQTLRSGQEELADQVYLERPVQPPTASARPFYYETRMVDRWFDQTIAPPAGRKP